MPAYVNSFFSGFIAPSVFQQVWYRVSLLRLSGQLKKRGQHRQAQGLFPARACTGRNQAYTRALLPICRIALGDRRRAFPPLCDAGYEFARGNDRQAFYLPFCCSFIRTKTGGKPFRNVRLQRIRPTETVACTRAFIYVCPVSFQCVLACHTYN